jgi:hypothetical protein
MRIKRLENRKMVLGQFLAIFRESRFLWIANLQ